MYVGAHKLVNISTKMTVLVRNKKYGSPCTVHAHLSMQAKFGGLLFILLKPRHPVNNH